MKKKALLMLLLGMFFASLMGSQIAPTAQAKESIKMGIMVELTGPGSYYGVLAKHAIELRLEEANYQVAGKPIEVIWEDTGSDPALAVQKAKKLVELDHVDLLFGPCFSDSQDAMAPYVAKRNIMNIAPIGGNWVLHKYGNWIVFPGTPETSDMPLGDYAYDKGYRTVVSIGHDFLPGYAHVNGAVNRFKERGGTVVQQLWVSYGTVDYGPYIASLKKADVLILGTFLPDTLHFLKQSWEFGLELPILYCEADGLTSQQMAELGKRIEGLKGILRVYTRVLDNPVNHKFVPAWKAKTGEYPEEMAACGYTCMSIYLAGLEATGGEARLDVIRPAILGLRLDGPGGPVSFTPNGYAVTNRYLAEVKLVNGEYAWVPFKTFTNVRGDHGGK